MFTHNFSLAILILCISIQGLASPVPFVGKRALSSKLNGILGDLKGIDAILDDIRHILAPPNFGLLSKNQTVAYEDEDISKTAAWISSQLATVDLLYTHPTPVTVSKGLKSVLSSGVKSATGGHVSATTEAKIASMILCVPTSDTVPTSRSSARATITSAPTVVPIDPKYITTVTSNGRSFPILKNFSSVAHVTTATVTAVNSTASTDLGLISPLTSDTPVALSTVAVVPTTGSGTQEIARRLEPSATSTIAPSSPSETSVAAQHDAQGNKAEEAAVKEARKKLKEEPVVLHNCSYPQINGHRLGRDSKGDIVILVEDPWLEAVHFSLDFPGPLFGCTARLLVHGKALS